MSILAPWWTPDAVRSLLDDLVAAELTRLRPGLPPGQRPGPDPVLAPELGHLTDLDDLGLDSLERLDLATTVAVQFHLGETGLDRALLAQPRLADWTAIILESRRRWDLAVSFQTSGSTGRPRMHPHALALLGEEIDWFAERLAGHRRLLLAVPRHHIYGFLFGLMLPARLGLPVLDVRDRPPAGVLTSAQPGDLLIAHPAFLEMARRGLGRVAPGVGLVTSTAPCPPELWRDLVDAGFERILEVYGASETAGIAVRTEAAAPFALLPHWSRTHARDTTGDDPEGSSTTGLVRRDGKGGLLERALPDTVAWLDDRHFRVLGRQDAAVQVGGINVYPERVRACLRAHPEVAAAAVRLGDPAQGGRLKAFVVPAADCQDPAGLPARLAAWLANRLTPAEQPRAITLGAQLPRSPLGKPQDWEPSP